jgi:hypothetical protein
VLYPAELCDHSVGVAGFEPAASTSQTWRDNRATLHPELVIKFILNKLRILKKINNRHSINFKSVHV